MHKPRNAGYSGGAILLVLLASALIIMFVCLYLCVKATLTIGGGL